MVSAHISGAVMFHHVFWKGMISDSSCLDLANTLQVARIESPKSKIA